jgi:hypothetical protein
MTKKWNGFTLSCTMNHYNMLGLSIKKPDAALFIQPKQNEERQNRKG